MTKELEEKMEEKEYKKTSKYEWVLCQIYFGSCSLVNVLGDREETSNSARPVW